jgi:hypothetical protein
MGKRASKATGQTESHQALSSSLIIRRGKPLLHSLTLCSNFQFHFLIFVCSFLLLLFSSLLFSLVDTWVGIIQAGEFQKGDRMSLYVLYFKPFSSPNLFPSFSAGKGTGRGI